MSTPFHSGSSAARPLPGAAPVVPRTGAAWADAVLLARLRALARAYLANPALTPARLAAAAHLSERTRYRRLHELTGHTPAAFVRELRLWQARQLLRAGRPAPLAAVAHAVGFVNAAHFGRVYAWRFGQPPGQEREAFDPCRAGKGQKTERLAGIG